LSDGAFQTIRLWDPKELSGTPWSGRLEFLPASDGGSGTRPLVLVVPGGGYAVNAPKEGHPVARWLSSCGIHAAVLDYRVAPYAMPLALADMRRAIRVLRFQAAALGITSDAITALGFSAGGHLAGLCALRTGFPEHPADTLAETVAATPDRLMLMYPVISFLRNAHEETVRNLLQDRAADRKLRGAFSLEENLTCVAPPVLIANGTDDVITPIANAQMLRDRLQEAGVRAQLFRIDGAPHGFVLSPTRMGSELRAKLLEWVSKNSVALA
jgi:acetyl esterase/lipase